MEHQKNEQLTPLMQQYFQFKEEFPDTLLFFQVGDFFELFFDDAKKAATFLGITLSSRAYQRSLLN
jgi:DNA mismatch repair protein MutS